MVRGTRLAVGIALGSAALLAAAFALAWHPEIERITPPAAASFDRALVAGGRETSPGSAIAPAAIPPSAAGRSPAAARLQTPFGTVFATNITPDAETGIGRWSREAFDARDARGVAPQRRASLSRLSLRPFHPRERRRSRRALRLADDAAARAGARAGQSSSTGLFGFRPLVAAWNLLYLRRGPARRRSGRSRPTGIAAARWPRAWRIAAAAIRRATASAPRDSDARLRRRLDRRLVRAAAQCQLARGAAVDGRPASSPTCAPASARRHAAAAGPMGGVTRGLAQASDDGCARDRRLLRLPDGATRRPRSRTADRRTGRRVARRRPIPRPRRSVRRRLRDLPRARRADDAAGPAAARLGHAAARGHAHDTVRIIMQGLAPPAGPIGSDHAGLRRHASRPSAARAHRLSAHALHRQAAVARHPATPSRRRAKERRE